MRCLSFLAGLLCLSQSAICQNNLTQKFTEGASWEVTNYSNCKEESRSVSTVLKVVKAADLMTSTIRDEQWVNGKKESELTYEIKSVNGNMESTCCQIFQAELGKKLAADPGLDGLKVNCKDLQREVFPSAMKIGMPLLPARSNTIFKVKSEGQEEVSLVSTREKTNRVVTGKKTISTPAGTFENCWIVEYDLKMETKMEFGKQMQEVMKGMEGGMPVGTPMVSKRRQYYDPKIGAVIREENREDSCDYSELTK